MTYDLSPAAAMARLAAKYEVVYRRGAEYPRGGERHEAAGRCRGRNLRDGAAGSVHRSDGGFTRGALRGGADIQGGVDPHGVVEAHDGASNRLGTPGDRGQGVGAPPILDDGVVRQPRCRMAMGGNNKSIALIIGKFAGGHPTRCHGCHASINEYRISPAGAFTDLGRAAGSCCCSA